MFDPIEGEESVEPAVEAAVEATEAETTEAVAEVNPGAV